MAIGTSDEIIQKHGSPERLEIHGMEQLENNIRANTELKVDYNGRRLITVTLNGRIDALTALAAAEQSGLEWGDTRTRRDSLKDVFVHLVSGTIGEHGETKTAENPSNKRRR